MNAIRLDAPAIAVRFHFGADADQGIALPAYQTSHSAGLDVCANFPADLRASGLTLAPGARVLVPTGLHIAVPVGFEMQIRPRSGLALKHGVTLLNAPGTIDSDYRGEVGVILINHGEAAFAIAHGDRIAQMVLAPVARCSWVRADQLDITRRGKGGFGSTGR